MPRSKPSAFRRFALAFGMTLSLSAGGAAAQDPENTLVIEMEDGRIVIEMRPDLAPNHVERIKTLARQGFYDGVVFHRVIEDFMAQTGDPTGTGRGGSDLPDLRAEFTDTHFGRGTVGMARTQAPHSANSQWFICFTDCGFLNGQYTVWGQVVEGMDVVDSIKKGEGRSGAVDDPDAMVSVRVAADAAE
jgi:cyclophilin family peptidyl-prolyl cis-trans isomerase